MKERETGAWGEAPFPHLKKRLIDEIVRSSQRLKYQLRSPSRYGERVVTESADLRPQGFNHERHEGHEGAPNAGAFLRGSSFPWWFDCPRSAAYALFRYHSTVRRRPSSKSTFGV
jgi:hypothetical protein